MIAVIAQPDHAAAAQAHASAAHAVAPVQAVAHPAATRLEPWAPDWAPDWAVTLVLAAAAVAVALIVHAVLERVLSRLTRERSPSLYQAIARTRNVLRLAFVLLALQSVLPSLALEKGWADWAHHVLTAGFVVLFGWVVLVAANIAADRYVGRYQIDVADNLMARKLVTQMRVLRRVIGGTIIVITAALALMAFPSVRTFGMSLFASAGVAGIVAGVAARPVFENMLAGLQIALTQPIRLDDVVIVNGEWGRVEEITSAYVVVKIWDLRRMIVPLSYFISNPFENWTRSSANLLGAVLIYLDYSAPVAAIRAEAEKIVRACKLWDGQTVGVQITDASEQTMQLRVLATAVNSSQAFDLRCEIREKLIAFIQENYPQALPRQRNEQRAIQPDIVYPPHPGERLADAVQTAARGKGKAKAEAAG